MGSRALLAAGRKRHPVRRTGALALLLIPLLFAAPAKAEQVEIIPAGRWIAGGCTPDGACWPVFVTRRTVRIVVVGADVLPHKRGTCICNGPSPIIMIRPGGGYTYQDLVGHELGHDNGVTRHADGSVWKAGDEE